MLLKKLGTVFFTLLAFNSYSQQLVRATNVELVTTPGTRLVMQGGGISFTGTTNWNSNGDSIYLYKTTATPNEGWLDSTTNGVLAAASTGHVFFMGTNRQSFYGKTRFYNFTLRNTGGDTLLSSCEVRNNLHLDTGFVYTESGYGNDSLWVSNPAINAITSTSSFTRSWVNGRLSRSGNVIGSATPNPAIFYLFPIGKPDSLYAPIKLAKVNTNNTVWTAEYTYATPFDRTNILNPPIDHLSQVEYWEITSNTQASTNDDAMLSLSWRGASYVSTNPLIRDSLLVAQYIDNVGFRWEVPGSWAAGRAIGADSLFGFVTSNAASNNYTFDERRFSLGTFSKYNALPARLLYFTAIADGNKVRLNWEVANEQETLKYELEKSLNATSFTYMGTITSRQMQQSAYTDFDHNPATGWNYYRLKVIDKSGSFFYSPVRPVKFDKGLEQVKIFPVPATTVVNVQLPTSYVNQSTLQVFGSDGKFIASLKPQANMVIINVQPLASGTYFIQVTRTSGEKETYRFVKQ